MHEGVIREARVCVNVKGAELRQAAQPGKCGSISASKLDIESPQMTKPAEVLETDVVHTRPVQADFLEAGHVLEKPRVVAGQTHRRDDDRVGSREREIFETL